MVPFHKKLMFYDLIQPINENTQQKATQKPNEAGEKCLDEADRAAGIDH